MKQSKTTMKELTRRYRAVLIKCALMNLAAFSVAMPAKAEDLIIDANSSKIISRTDKCSGSSCGGSYGYAWNEGYDKLKMTGGEFKIDRLNTDNDSVGFYFSDVSTISGGKLTLSTPNQSSGADSDGVNLYFENGLTVTGKNTVLDFSGNSRISVGNQFNVTDATIYIHDAFQEPIDGTGTINFTNVKTIVSNASFSPWDSGLSSDVTITDDEYNALPENQKAQYVKEQPQQDFYYKIMKDPLTGKYFSAEDAKKYRLYEEVYHKAGDFTINGGTLSVSKGSFATDRNIITDGTEISLSNASYMAVAGEDEYSDGSLFNQEVTFKGNSTVNVSGGSYIFTGHMSLPYQKADDYYLDNGLLTEAEMAKSAKPNEANANINIQDSTIITLNDTSAIALLDKNSGKINMTGGKINMNDSSSIYGALEVNGGELNVNGNNSIKNNLYITGNWDKDIYNGMESILFWEAEGTAPEIALQSGAINLNGVLTGNIAATGGTIAFGKESARLNGVLSGSNVDLIFKDNYALSNLNNKATLKNITISAGKTLDIGTGTLTADLISGGTISAILTDAAQTSAIVNATAKNATLKLDMSNASRDAVTEYKITNGVGFTFGDYATNRYAVSDSVFDIADAKTLEKLSNWKGGNLWILRLATASEAAIEDLEKSGVALPESEKQASKILDLANEVLNKLPEHTQKIIEKVNDLLDKAAGKTAEVRQILKEVAPDTAQSGAKTATSTAKSVINVVGSRFGGGVKSGGSFGGRGRSGGDYAAGRSSVWAQGMMNYAKLDKEDGFNAHSNGFAAGAEVNFTDSFKAGIGYAYTSGDISTDRAQTDVDTHTGFVYGAYKPHKAYVNGVVSYGHSKYDEKTRTVGLTSDYNADTIAAQIAAGYDFGLLTPEAAVRFTNVRLKEYTDAAGATLRDKTQNTWTGVAGIKAAKGYHLTANPKINFTPELKVAATYDFARDDENRTVVLPDHSSYVASGDPMKRFGVETGAGLTVAFGNTSELSVSYEGKFKDHYKDHTGMINLKVNF